MEKRFAALSLPDTDSDHKLTKAVSFSELPNTRRVLVEQFYQSGSTEGLVRQYSCEQILHKNSNIRQVKVSELVRSGASEHRKTWETTVPLFGNIKNIGWITDRGKNINEVTESNITYQMKQPELMEVEEIASKKLQNSFPRRKLRQSNLTKFHKINNLQDVKMSNTKRIVEPSRLLSNNFVANTQQEPSQLLKPEANSNAIADVHLTNSSKYNQKKGRLRSLVPKNSAKTNKKKIPCSFHQIIFFLLLPVAITLATVFLNQESLIDHFCKHRFDFKNAAVALQSRLYGQQQAVEELIDYFQKNSDTFKLVAFVGGTGVGKSYAAEIIKETFPNQDKIFVYSAPLQNCPKEISTMYFFCHCSLIILENLSTEDLIDAATFSALIKEHAINQCVTILALINMQDTDNELKRTLDLQKSISQVDAAFYKVNLEPKIIGFETLNEDVLEKCIYQVANERNISLTQSDVEYIRQGLIIANSGCKGAYAKVQLMNKEEIEK
ncbi:uncharacterized protein LOC107273907 [Cephus cinctus]|uniref:Uncharacterized protein LOC107273907 n=1 Tax=Cephus cinctus TaxID=211228 RepID=A0AAJ7FTW6_CEPCN|nr:uncharacterized protein LOC107273907 [Cephus cinctus]XP_015608034.1 uncharacterized protein LOC107273907 [Cephus cinctus]XP_024946533.1 uncharacterized protein LOC107273907 [Cephus cinctus]